MTSANNAQKIGDPEKAPVSATTPAAHLEQRQEQAKSNNMKKIQHFGFSLLLLAVLAITIAAASKTSPRHAPAMSAEERIKLQELLNTIEPASLHEILHKHLKDKYQHGVYQEDKAAMEVVAQSNKDVAHSLIELAKRQAPNTTTTVIEAVTTTTTDITIPTSVPVTTTDEETTAVAPPTTVVAPPTTSAGNVPTTPATSPPPNQVPTTSQQDTQGTTAETNPTSAAQNPTSTAANGGAGTKSAVGGGTATETSLSTAVVTKTQNPPTTSGSSTNGLSSATPAISSGSPGSSSSGAGHTPSSSLAVSSPGSIKSNSATDKSSSKGSSPTSDSSVTQETVFTTTRPDGSVATVTSVTVVPAGQAEHTGTSGATKTNGSPSLQSNGATPMVVGLNGVMGMLGLVVVGVL